MYVLHIPSWFPDDRSPYAGNFIEKHIAAIAMFYPSVSVKVVFTDHFQQRKSIDRYGNETRITYYIKRRRWLPARLFSKIYRNYLYRKGIGEIYKEYGKPDLVHLHVALPMGFLARKISKKYHIPLVLTEHWTIYQPQNADKFTDSLNGKLKKIYDSVSGYTTVSENLRLIINGKYPGIDSTVIPNVVDTKLFLPDHQNNDKINIIHISTLKDEAKNFIGILHVIEKLAAIRKDFVLKVIHENPNEKAEKFVRDHDLSSHVVFLGNRNEEEVARELGKSDFLLLFSNYENLPCVIIESFSCGKPVLVTDVGGIREIVDQSRGIMVEAKNENLLLEKLNWMLDHYREYDKDAIRDYAADHFSKEIIGKQFADFYHHVLFKQK